jgi:hypothetical protein
MTKKALVITPTFQEPPIQTKEPLPPEVIRAIDTLNTYIICCKINWTSHRQAVRTQTQRALTSFVMSLDALSFAEYMEQQEYKRKYAPKPVTMPEQQRRSA